MELCLTPTYSSWAHPIECHIGPLRDFLLDNSGHPNHSVLTRRLHDYLAWRNTHAADPELRERLRRERARQRCERQRRWGRPAPVPATRAPSHRHFAPTSPRPWSLAPRGAFDSASDDPTGQARSRPAAAAAGSHPCNDTPVTTKMKFHGI